jgi:hypothetical protein
MKNSENLRAGVSARAGVAAGARALLHPHVCIVGVATTETLGVPDGPRDWLRVRALDWEVEGALEGVLDLALRVVDEPRLRLGGDPRVAETHLIFFVVQKTHERQPF